MANLETLELTINGSAEKASQGIDTLISRLSLLSSAITKPCGDLRDFNNTLKETARISKTINFKNIGKNVGASVEKGVTSKAVFPTAREIAESNAKMEAMRKANALPAEALQAQQEVSKRLISERMAETSAKRQAFQATAQAEAQRRVTDEVHNTSQAVEENKSALSKVKEGFGNMTSGISGFFSKVKRIATTMLIRSAIRNLIKDIKEGVNNVYEWSKLNGGEFAKSFDTLKAKSQQLKNSIGAAIAPAIQAAIPIINALASAAIIAFNYVNQLIALLTGQNYWTKATDNVDAYTDSVNKAGGAAKEWLASFDELNVMTSGGGGGGGGSSGITSDMFENTSKFNETLKEIVGFIKANFEDIKLIAEGIGVAILSWKLAKGFLDTIPALSKIAGAIGVGATIAITLKANYLLTNQYLKTGEEGWLIASALTTAIGATAAGVIAKNIFGKKAAMVTIGFTLVLSAVTDIIANVENTDVSAFSKEGLLTSISAALKAGAGAGILLKAFNVGGVGLLAGVAGAAALTFLVSTALKLMTSTENIKWGSFEATEKQIDTFVQERMFDATAIASIKQIEVAEIKVDDITTQVNEKLAMIASEFNVLKLGIDKTNTYANLNDYINGEDGLVSKIKDLSDVNIALLKVTYGSMQAYDGEGNAISSDTLFSGIEGWNRIKNEMTIKGKELSELLVKGANDQLTPKMEKYTEKLLTEVQETMRKITNAESFATAAYDMQTAMLDAFSENSFNGVITAFENYSNSNKETIEKGWRKVAESWLALANYEDDPEKKAQYQKIANDIISGLEQTVAEELDKANAPGKSMIVDWIFGQVGTIDGDVSRTITERLKGYGLTSERFTEMIRKALVENGMNSAVIPVMDIVDFSGWDLLSKELKTKFLANVTISDKTIKEIAKAGVSAMELVELVEWDKVKGMTQEQFINTMSTTFGASGIDAIRHRFPDIKASQIIQFSGWKDFSDTQKLEFVNAIGNAFGNQEAATAAKNAGINLEKSIKEGMNSQNEDIRKMAQKWAEIMGIEIKGGDYTVKPEVDPKSKPKIQQQIIDTVANVKTTVKDIIAKWKPGTVENLGTDVSNVKASVTPAVVITGESKNNAISAIEGIKATITATVTASGIDKIAQAFKKALSAKVSLITDSGKQVGSATIAVKGLASGGLVNSGDIFIANENGVSEMIGRFGNQTGVANNSQIVAGISRGVYEANEEQNELLREQNALLRALYEKDGGSGMPGVSAALGRQLKRSLDAYSGLVGG